MIYNYLGDNTTGEYRINEIKYTGNGSNTTYNTINFYYQKRSDVVTSYIAGSALNHTILLTGIKVIAENVLAFDYGFTYFNDGLYSKLNQISVIANGTKYNSTIVNWGTLDNTLTITDAGSDLGSLNKNQLYFGDFNGDGLTDYAKWDKKTTITVFMKQTDSGYTVKTIALPSDYSTTYYNNLEPYRITKTYNYSVNDIQVVDWNNDGKDEIMAHFTQLSEEEYLTNPHFDESDYPPHVNHYQYDNIYSYTYLNSNFVSASTSSITTAFSLNPISIADTLKFYYADFNNDGNMDRLIIENNTLYGCTNLTLASVPSVSNINDIKLLDFDGDGQWEFLALNSKGYGWIWKYNGSTFVNVFGDSTTFFGKSPNLFMGDFNGDGKTDYITYTGTAWHTYLSTGKAFVSITAPSELINNEPACTGNYIDGIDVYVAWSFICYKGFSVTDKLVDVQPKIANYKPATTILIDDINNDGKSDIIYALNGMVSVFISNGNSFTKQASVNISTASKLIDINLFSVDLFNNGHNN